MKIPHSPEDLSSDWLTRALQYGQVINTGIVSGFEYSPLEAGKGLYGQIVRLKPTYDPPDLNAPHTIIAKFSSGNPEMRQRPNTIASYEREISFYSEAAPESPLPVPDCYYADIDSESGWHILLLEDLAPARNGSRITGCSQAEALVAIQNIARFHAYWWENPKLNDFTWLSDTSHIPGDSALRHLREQLWPAFLKKVDSPLPDEIIRIGEWLGKHRDRVAQRLFINKPITLIHSDYHLDNMMFGVPENEEFFVLDWQFVKRGRGIFDVACFLSENLKSEDRQAIEMNLIQEYFRILTDCGVRDYSFDELIYDYRISLLNRFGQLVTTIAAMPFPEEQIRMHIDILLPRTISTMLANDCHSVLDT